MSIDDYSQYLEKNCFYDGCRGKIKFYGHVEGMKSYYFGVEWEARERGKHNGIYNGKKYFHCKPNCGSFIKPSKVVLKKSILKAIEDRYSKANNNPVDLTISNHMSITRPYVDVEFIGKNEKHDNYLNMKLKKHVNLDGLGISCMSDKEPLNIFLPNVEYLNLSYNLLQDFNEIFGIIHSLNNLKYLNLSRNYLDFSTLNPIKHYNSKVECLVLWNVTISEWSNVEKLLQCFVSVKELTLGDCRIIDICIKNIELYKNIKILDLSCNKLCNWSLVEQLAILPNLETLILRENRMKSIVINSPNDNDSCFGQKNSHYFQSLKCINLSENIFNTIFDVMQLAVIENLTDLRLNGNPLLYKSSSSRNYEDTWCEIVATFPHLEKLNQSDIDDKERRNCEIWFIRNRIEEYLSNENLTPYNRNHFDRLISKYHINSKVTELKKTSLRGHLYTLVLCYNSHKSTISVPREIKVRHLKTLAEKIFGTEIYCNEINFISKQTKQLSPVLYQNHDLLYNNIENGDTILFDSCCVSPK